MMAPMVAFLYDSQCQLLKGFQGSLSSMLSRGSLGIPNLQPCQCCACLSGHGSIATRFGTIQAHAFRRQRIATQPPLSQHGLKGGLLGVITQHTQYLGQPVIPEVRCPHRLINTPVQRLRTLCGPRLDVVPPVASLRQRLAQPEASAPPRLTLTQVPWVRKYASHRRGTPIRSNWASNSRRLPMRSLMLVRVSVILRACQIFHNLLKHERTVRHIAEKIATRFCCCPRKSGLSEGIALSR